MAQDVNFSLLLGDGDETRRNHWTFLVPNVIKKQDRERLAIVSLLW